MAPARLQPPNRSIQLSSYHAPWHAQPPFTPPPDAVHWRAMPRPLPTFRRPEATLPSRLPSLYALTVALTLVLTGCTSAAQVRQKQEVLRQAELARVQGEERRQAEQAAKLEAEALALLQDRLARFAALVDKHTPLLAILEHWEQHGDTPVDQLADIVAVVPRLSELRPLAELCDRELQALARQTDDIGKRVHGRCRLAVRAKDILERQYLASVRLHVSFPENLREAAKRYRQFGRVGWHQIEELEGIDAEIVRRKAYLQPLAAIVGLPVLDEPFRHGQTARRELRAAIKHGLQSLELPAGATDTAFETQVRALVQAIPADVGPMPGARQGLLQVRAQDVAWQKLIANGRLTRRDRRAIALFSTKQAGECAVLWVRIEQAAVGRAWGKAVATLDDDVRWIRCPVR